jgi:hypothetical protein
MWSDRILPMPIEVLEMYTNYPIIERRAERIYVHPSLSQDSRICVLRSAGFRLLVFVLLCGTHLSDGPMVV